MRTSVILATSSLLALTSPGHAQTTPPAPETANAAGLPSENATGDIIVTAQRRSENLRDVPIAITVVNGESLRETGATQLADITQRAPSVQFTAVPSNPTFTIRGISTASFDLSVESAVGLAVDDVNITLPRFTPLNTLADVERIEVLRGPQGLLFGKNTTAGLISVTTRRPQLDTYSNEGRLQAGSRDQVQAYDILNVPLGSDAALRLRASYQYQQPVYNVRGPGQIADTRSYDFNGKLLWNVTDRLSLYAIGDYQDNRGDPGVWTIRTLGTGGTSPAVGNQFIRTQLAALGIVPGPDNRDTAIGADNFTSVHSTGGQATLAYDLDGATITSVTAYRDAVTPNSNLEVDSTPLPVYDNNYGTLHANQFSQELRVASSGERTVEYVAGLYYWRQSIHSTQAQYGTLGLLPNASPVLIGSSGGLVTYDVASRSYAAFAQGTLHLGERLRLIAGGRYTRDTVDSTTGVSAIPGVCSVSLVLTGGQVCEPIALPYAREADRRAGGFSGRGGIQYDIAGTANVYFTYSRGYKGPAISSINANVYPVNPETVDAFELGAKVDLLDRHLSLNLAAFTNQFHDFQAQVFDPTIGAVGGFRTGNAGGLRTRGIEAEAIARSFAGLSLSGGVTYLDATYTDYFPACYPGQTAAQGCTLAGPTFDARGLPTIAAPRWATSFVGAYQTRVTDDLKAFVNADWSYRSRVYYGVGDPGTIQPGYSLVNATLGIGTADDKVRVSVFVRNMFDKRFAALIFPSYFDKGGYSQVLPDNAFRRIGAALEWRF